MRTKSGSLEVMIKIVLLAATLIFIYIKLRDNQQPLNHLRNLLQEVLSQEYLYLLLVILLMPLNWALEALKWKMLARSVVALSFFQAYQGVLSGLGLGFITPHGLGDYLGRIGQLEGKQRTRLLGAVFIGRLSQMLITGSMGLLGIYFLYGTQALFIGAVAGTCLLFLLLSLGKIDALFVIPYRIVQKIKPFVIILAGYSKTDLASVLMYSLLRYMVFSFQFLVMLEVFLPDVSAALKIAGISWVFLAKSVLPTFNFLSDLGVREASAILFFEKYDVALEPVIAASLLLWVINILVPTLLSLPFIFKLRFSIK